jgi:hypothetical protein
MKKTIASSSVILITFLFLGCSTSKLKDDFIEDIPERNESTEDSQSENLELNSSDETNYIEENSSDKIISVPFCDDMILVNSGDRIVKKSENSEVKIQHLANGTKYICLKSGECEIHRANFE